MVLRHLSINDFVYLLAALRWTLLLSAIAFAGGGALGAIVTGLRIARSAAVRQVAGGYIALLQGTPLLTQLFLFYFGISFIGLDLPPLVAAALALSLYTSAYLAEIWRGTIEAIPRPQWEGAEAIGLSRLQLLIHVIVPQAVRIALPPTVGFLVQTVKNTSLASLIGFVELARAGQIVNNATFEPLIVFLAVAVLYFCMCFPLSSFAGHLEWRLNAYRRSEAHP